MKPKFYILVLCSLIFACKKGQFDFESDFEKSLKAMESFRASSENSYRYIVSNGSVFGGASETIITVEQGKITERHFKYTDTTGFNSEISADELEWTESETEIGKHEYTGAAAARTLDQVYELAQKEWLLKRNNAQSYFETDDNGLISSCGYIIDGCQDDCFIGIKIKSIEPYNF